MADVSEIEYLVYGPDDKLGDISLSSFDKKSTAMTDANRRGPGHWVERVYRYHPEVERVYTAPPETSP